MDIEKLKEIDIDELVDIRDVKINMKLSKEERMLDYIKQIKNPYCYKYKNHKVIVTFNNDTFLTLKDCVEEYLNKY